jgi:H+-transporting ATPase
MIEVALALSLAARHWTDAVIIGVLLAMNGGPGISPSAARRS